MSPAALDQDAENTTEDTMAQPSSKPQPSGSKRSAALLSLLRGRHYHTQTAHRHPHRLARHAVRSRALHHRPHRLGHHALLRPGSRSPRRRGPQLRPRQGRIALRLRRNRPDAGLLRVDRRRIGQAHLLSRPPVGAPAHHLAVHRFALVYPRRLHPLPQPAQSRRRAAFRRARRRCRALRHRSLGLRRRADWAVRDETRRDSAPAQPRTRRPSGRAGRRRDHPARLPGRLPTTRPTPCSMPLPPRRARPRPRPAASSSTNSAQSPASSP